MAKATVKTSRAVPRDIIRAMNGMFRPWFAGESWDGWRTILKATAGQPMTLAEVEFFKSVAGGREPPSKRPREAWFVCGRRAGKDSIVSLIAAHSAASFDPRGILRPGERAVVACTAPDKETARIIHRYIIAFFEAIPSLKAMVQRTTDELIELSNMVDIAILTSNHRVVRGRPILCAILDEVALLRSDESTSPDVELYNAMTPGMATIPQAQIFGISSPYAKKGLLYTKHRDNFGTDNDDVLIVQAPSHVMNPVLDTRDRDRMMAEDPARARAEWYAEFRDDIIAFVDPATVDRAVVKGRTELRPVPGVNYTAAVDPSGGSSDSMTLAIAHTEGERGILDFVQEWPAPFSPEVVVGEIVEICRRYGAVEVIGDRYAGEWAREPFRLKGIGYRIAAHSRSEAYLTMLPAINTPGRIELLDHLRLISQLCALERRTARSGRDTVDHPRGGHDDVINAAALALVAATLTPTSSADNWIEFYRRQAQRAGIDVDGIRASGPDFKFEFNAKPPEPLIRLFVPAAIVNGYGNGNTVTVAGERFMYRHDGDRGTYVEVTAAAAAALLEFEIWRGENPGALGDGVAA